MRALLDERGLDGAITVDSAGTSSEHLGEPPDRRTIAEAQRRGLDVESHRVWRFEGPDFDRFDLVLAADHVNERRLLDRARTDADRAKVHLIRHWVDDEEMPDPWYGGAEGFVLTFDLAHEACVALLDHLTAS